jgi:hypothetical protein
MTPTGNEERTMAYIPTAIAVALTVSTGAEAAHAQSAKLETNQVPLHIAGLRALPAASSRFPRPGSRLRADG